MESFRRVDATKGRYLSASRIVQEEGGDMEARRAAEKYIRKCILFKPPWIIYNQMTERHDFLYLERGFTEEMSKAWNLYTEQYLAPDSENKEVDNGEHKPIDDKKESMEQPAPKETPTNGRNIKGGNTEAGGKDSTVLDEATSKATAVKKKGTTPTLQLLAGSCRPSRVATRLFQNTIKQRRVLIYPMCCVCFQYMISLLLTVVFGYVLEDVYFAWCDMVDDCPSAIV